MGYVEDVMKMDLSDDVKQNLIQAHESEINPLRQTNQSLSAKTRRDAVEAEVKEFADMGFEEEPGLLKYLRRILLSADAEEPGAVLLSDDEMGLSGDLATGAKGREDISVAGALRGFINLLPRDKDTGKVLLSDQAIASEDEDRPSGGDSGDSDGARKRLGNLTGKDLSRSSRGKRYSNATVTGGGE